MLSGLLLKFFFKLWNGWKKNILELTMWNSCPQTLKKESCSKKSKNNTKQTYWFSSLCLIARNQYRWQQPHQKPSDSPRTKSQRQKPCQGDTGDRSGETPQPNRASGQPCTLPSPTERWGQAFWKSTATHLHKERTLSNHTYLVDPTWVRKEQSPDQQQFLLHLAIAHPSRGA